MITWIILRYAMYSKESSFNGKRIGYTEWWKLRTFGVKKENRPALIQKIAKDNIPVKKIEALARPVIKQQVQEILDKTEKASKKYHDLRKKQEDDLNNSGKRNYGHWWETSGSTS
jgi:hypothetical protein